MRILMITDFYRPYVGGVEQHVRRLSHALIRRGYEVAVATLGRAGLAEFELDGPVRVHRIQGLAQRLAQGAAPGTRGLFKNPQRTWAPPFPDPGLVSAIKQVVELERPDIVHGHDWLARSFLPLKAGSRAGLVMSLHYYTLSCAKKSLFIGDRPCSGPGPVKCLRCAAGHYGIAKGVPVTLANWFFSASERAAVDMFLPVSRATAAGNGLPEGDRCRVIPNFMPETQAPAGESEAYLSQLPAGPFLLFVGDLRSAKGLDVLLSAYSDLQEAPPLVLIGKPWPETPRSFPPNVLVFENWPNEAVLSAFARCLFAIVPSLWPEPFGLVVIEAMTGGRPLIASRVGGIPELVDEEMALLLPPGDAQALREAIAFLLDHPELRERMADASRRKAAGYREEAVLPRIEEVYREVRAAAGGVRRQPGGRGEPRPAEKGA